MRVLRILPVALGEPKKSSDLLPWDIIHQGTNRPRLFEPVALPQLARSDALVMCFLKVDAAGHRTAVDGVVDSVFVLEPHLVPPFLGLSTRVRRCIVVDQVAVCEIRGEGRFLERWVHGHGGG